MTTVSAAVTQPDGVTVVPIDQALSTDYFDTNRYTAATLGLQNLLNAREGAGVIDIQADASTQPATFSPLCGLKGTMILRGGSCLVDFGWYCVDHPETVHPLVTKADIVTYHDTLLDTFDATYGPPPPPLNSWSEYKNNDKGFVPTIQMPPLEGATGLADVRSHPDFDPSVCPSQAIGFAFVGNPTSFCPQSKYSEQRLNEACSLPACGGQPWVSALVYQSRATYGGVYIAFEDLPTRPESFSPALTSLAQYYPDMKQPEGWDGSNDGDFNDFVYFVEGIQCLGGGQPCDTGQPGICSAGVTECVSVEGTEPACTQTIEAAEEVCDDLDNDCDGAVDEDTCPPGEICVEGNCIKGCSPTEFPCNSPLVCETEGIAAGYCVDPDCKGMDCNPGEICRDGQCIGGCQGVVCPGEQECVLGRCIDFCESVPCDGDFVCKRGVCVMKCQCAGCLDGEVCGQDGRCVEAGCENQACSQGQVCRGGSCMDGCEGVVCPYGMQCENGVCPPHDPKNPMPIDPSTLTGDDGTDGLAALDDGSGTGPGNNGSATGGAVTPPAEPGCGCAVPGSHSRQPLWVLGLGFAAWLALGRRRGSRAGA